MKNNINNLSLLGKILKMRPQMERKWDTISLQFAPERYFFGLCHFEGPKGAKRVPKGAKRVPQGSPNT